MSCSILNRKQKKIEGMSALPSRIAVMGGGSWGTAITKMLSEHKRQQGSKIKELRWWVRNAETADYIRTHRRNPKYISSVEIHPDIVNVTSDLAEVIRESEL